MDRATLSDAIIDELGQLFAATLRQNAEQLVASDLDGIEQHLQVAIRGVLGRVVEEIVVAISRAHSLDRPNCPGCKRPMRPVDYSRPRLLQGLVGDYRIGRAYFHCEHCKVGLAPLDERLGLGAGALSPGLERVACRLGMEESFEDAADVLGETLGIEVATEAIRRVTEGIGQVAEEEVQGDWVLHGACGEDGLSAVCRGTNLPIGSGAIESTCKTLIEAREKGAGMRWVEEGAQQVASLRALHRSGRWAEFWRGHPQRRRPTVFPRREPQSTLPATSRKKAA